jgi:N-acetylmuramoyl-L-alanine amidase
VTETHGEQSAPPPRESKPAADASLAGLRVNLDPGHNGGNSAAFNSQVPPATQQLLDAGVQLSSPQCDTSGTSTNAGYPESAFTLDVARRTRTELERRGATVTMTRDSNATQGPCTFERAAIGNQADVAISIHADGSGAANRGFHVIPPAPLAGYTDDIAESSARLGQAVRARVLATGMPTANYIGSDGIDPRANLVGLVLSNVPKVFLESGNMRNTTDAGLLTNPNYRQQIAEALADAIGVWSAGR